MAPARRRGGGRVAGAWCALLPGDWRGGRGGRGCQCVLERLDERPPALVALVGLLGERPREDRLDPGRQGGVEAAERFQRERLAQVVPQHAQCAGAAIGHPPGEQLVEDDAEGVEVGARVAPVPSGCSGAMYSGVPTIRPVPRQPLASSSTWAIPKSAR